MGVFDKILKDSETLFQNELALDYGFIPKIIPFREAQQQYIATCIKPLFQKHSGKNILIAGSPGIGKTVAVKHVLKELSDETEEILPLYINCWKKNTSYKVMLEMCELLDIKFIQALTTEQLIKKLASILNKKPVVICLDEVDKLENNDILYMLSEDISKKSIILITNERSWQVKLDSRIKSRLSLDFLEFQPYNKKETHEILKQRVEYAFYPKVFNIEDLEPIAELSFQKKDIRTGIYLLKESGLIAEQFSSKNITPQHIQKALSKLQEFKIRNSQDLTDDKKSLLEFIKQNQNKTSQELYELYSPETSYKTFQRRLQDLEQAGLVKLEVKDLGPGKSTIVSLPSSKIEKTLDKF